MCGRAEAPLQPSITTVLATRPQPSQTKAITHNTALHYTARARHRAPQGQPITCPWIQTTPLNTAAFRNHAQYVQRPIYMEPWHVWGIWGNSRSKIRACLSYDARIIKPTDATVTSLCPECMCVFFCDTICALTSKAASNYSHTLNRGPQTAVMPKHSFSKTLKWCLLRLPFKPELPVSIKSRAAALWWLAL